MTRFGYRARVLAEDAHWLYRMARLHVIRYKLARQRRKGTPR